MAKRQRGNEVWRRAMGRMKKASGPAQAKALQEEMKSQGIAMSEAVKRVVEEFSAKDDPTEDQVRDLAVTLAKFLGLSVDRFVALWREGNPRR